jgi:hypothetical protein
MLMGYRRVEQDEQSQIIPEPRSGRQNAEYGIQQNCLRQESLTYAALAKRLYWDRRTRGRHVDEDQFADPAWDIFLELFAAEEERRQICVSSLGIAAAVPSTTALRWVALLIDTGKLVKTRDALDGRRSYVTLHTSVRDAMKHYFDEIAPRWNLTLVESCSLD